MDCENRKIQSAPRGRRRTRCSDPRKSRSEYCGISVTSEKRGCKPRHVAAGNVGTFRGKHQVPSGSSVPGPSHPRGNRNKRRPQRRAGSRVAVNPATRKDASEELATKLSGISLLSDVRPTTRQNHIRAGIAATQWRNRRQGRDRIVDRLRFGGVAHLCGEKPVPRGHADDGIEELTEMMRQLAINDHSQVKTQQSRKRSAESIDRVAHYDLSELKRPRVSSQAINWDIFRMPMLLYR